MGLVSTVKGVVKKPISAVKSAYNYGKSAYTGVSDYATGADGVESQEAAADKAATDVKTLGTDLTNIYDTAGASASGQYDDAAAKAGSTKAPTYLQDLYKSRTGYTPPSTPTRAPAGTTDQGTGVYYPPAPVGAPGPAGAPAPAPVNNSQGAYDSVKQMGPGYLDALAGGPGPDAHASSDVYQDVRNGGAPTYLKDLVDRGPRVGSTTGDRFKSRQGEGDVLGGLAGRRAGEENDPTVTEGYLGRLGAIAPGARGDAVASGLRGETSAAGGLLDKFDPTHTMAVGDVYNRIAADSGPSRSEGFFDSMQSGDNIALQRARERTTRESDRAAAALGGLNSGQKNRLKQEALDDIEAKNLQWLSSLAGQADEAKQSRYATLEGAAKPLDDTVMRGRELQGTLAGKKDQFTTERGTILGSLATSGDKAELDKAELGIKGGQAVDTVRGQAKDRTDTVTKDLATEKLTRSGQLDTLGTKVDDIQAERDKLQELIARGASQAEIDAQKNLIDAAEGADKTSVDLGKLAVDTASEADKHSVDMGKLGVDAASAADKTSLDWDEQQRKKDRDIADLAEKASGEQSGANKDALDAAIRIAEGKAGVDLKTAIAKGGAIQETTMAAIDTELAKSGIAPAQRQANINNLLKVLSLGL